MKRLSLVENIRGTLCASFSKFLGNPGTLDTHTNAASTLRIIKLKGKTNLLFDLLFECHLLFMSTTHIIS